MHVYAYAIHATTLWYSLNDSNIIRGTHRFYIPCGFNDTSNYLFYPDGTRLVWKQFNNFGNINNTRVKSNLIDANGKVRNFMKEDFLSDNRIIIPTYRVVNEYYQQLLWNGQVIMILGIKFFNDDSISKIFWNISMYHLLLKVSHEIS